MTAAPGARKLHPPTPVSKTNNPPLSLAGAPKTLPQKLLSGEGRRRAISMILYGPSGVGKTSFAANWPRCGVFYDPQETGIEDLVQYGQCPAPALTMKLQNFEKVLETASDIADKKYDIETAVFDSLTGLEKLCFAHHCREYFDNDWTKKGFYAYMAGPKNAAKTDWPRFLEAMDAIRESGINVILIGHSQIKPFNNPEGSDYDRWEPYLDKETWAQTHRWAQCVLFYNYYTPIEKEEAGLKKKANLSSERRLIYTVRTAAYDAKNRYGLSPVIDAGSSGLEAYQSFKEEFKKVSK